MAFRDQQTEEKVPRFEGLKASEFFCEEECSVYSTELSKYIKTGKLFLRIHKRACVPGVFDSTTSFNLAIPAVERLIDVLPKLRDELLILQAEKEERERALNGDGGLPATGNGMGSFINKSLLIK